MSADNWANCPRCIDRAKAEANIRFQHAAEAYGKVPPGEYEALRAAAQVPVDEDSFQTFREDYEFYGVSDGVITASYSGHCEVCDLGVDFQHTQPFYARESFEDVS